MNWLETHARAIGAGSALITALLALAALVGVKLQVDATAQLQAEQSARDIYRGFLELTIAQPELAQPDACLGITGPPLPEYDAYLDYLLYTAEQVTALDPDWDPVMRSWLVRHSSVICRMLDTTGFTPEVGDLIRNIRTNSCASIPACN